MTPEITLAAETVAHLRGLPLTNSLLTSWIVTGALVVSAVLFRRLLRPVPGLIQGTVEAVLEWLISLMTSVTNSRATSERLLPFIAGLFLFILAVNWGGLLPGVGSIGVVEKHGNEAVFLPLFRGGNADLNTTLALALVSVVATHWYGMRRLGAFRHIGKYLNVRNPIGFFLGILEAVAEGAKVLSFSFRLFGNIFAGEVLLVIVGSLVPFFAPLPFLGLELFVGFVQALVFSTLTLVFLELASAHAEH